MRIVLAADHGGYTLKNALREALVSSGHNLIDLGVEGPESVDYPDYARKATQGLIAGDWQRAILVCGSGVGMSIAANRVRGVRAVLCTDTYTARMSREHNDSNVLCLGARVLGVGLALDIVTTWLDTDFSSEPERHLRRIEKLDA